MEELYDQVDNYYKNRMPTECLDGFKKFTMCAKEKQAEVMQNEGLNAYNEWRKTPLSSREGCTGEYQKFHTCYSEFMHRYWDMKNYVCELEGRPREFDTKKLGEGLMNGNLNL